jgi:methionyl-tRNA synthetase
MASQHRAMWDALSITYTDFIRTTEDRHRVFVQEVLQKCFDRGDIYQGNYKGLYCVGCESFKRTSDLTEDGLCPDHHTRPQEIEEKNWFFRLSRYQKELEQFYESHSEFIVPALRFNEMKAFLKEGLEDFSISRETNTFGIPLPFDPEHVTYVWFDALLNYLTVCQGEDARFWPANVHVVGKEIARFHVLYWPAMLLSAGYELPKQILVTGFLTLNGQKMSKSLGNAMSPTDFLAKYPRDLLVLSDFLTFPIGIDGDFDEQQAITIYNAKLANNFGNLLNRTSTLAFKLGGTLAAPLDPVLSDKMEIFKKSYAERMTALDLKGALEAVFELSDILNKYVDTEKPWECDVVADKARMESILTNVAQGVTLIAARLMPFFPEKMKEVLRRLGINEEEKGLIGRIDARSASFTITEKAKPLFPRLEVAAK